MFRCPHCARVYMLPLSPNYALLANRNMDTFKVVKVPEFHSKDLLTSFRAIVYTVSSLEDAMEYVRQQGEELYQTHVCPACQEASDLREWELAFEDPMAFFDKEHICGCGNELWMDVIPSERRYGYTCDKCGWVKPGIRLSGSADVTVT